MESPPGRDGADMAQEEQDRRIAVVRCAPRACRPPRLSSPAGCTAALPSIPLGPHCFARPTASTEIRSNCSSR